MTARTLFQLEKSSLARPDTYRALSQAAQDQGCPRVAALLKNAAREADEELAKHEAERVR